MIQVEPRRPSFSAVQWTGSNYRELMDFFGGAILFEAPDQAVLIWEKTPIGVRSWRVERLNTERLSNDSVHAVVPVNGWLVRVSNGANHDSIEVLKNDMFCRKYQRFG